MSSCGKTSAFGCDFAAVGFSTVNFAASGQLEGRTAIGDDMQAELGASQKAKAPSWRIWIEAARPKTLAAAVVPVTVGTTLAAAHDGEKFGRAAICLAFALLVQIGTNFANDY